MSSSTPPRTRVAVAGLGFGAAVHVPAIKRIPGVEVCAIAGANEARTQERARQLQIPIGVEGFTRLMECSPDAVMLALPPAVNEEAAKFFVQHRVPVLSEKPLAMSSSAAEELVRAARGLPCGVDFEFAELPAFLAARQEIEARAIGDIRCAHISWATESFARRNGLDSWKTSPDGGVLPLLFSHTAYLIEWLLGSVTTVFAVLRGASPVPAYHALVDSASVILTLAQGAVVNAFVTNAAPGASVHRWEIVGSEGTLIIENQHRQYMNGFRVVSKFRNEERVLFADETQCAEDDRIAPVSALVNRFLECVRSGRHMTPSFEDGWRSTRILDAIRESAQRAGVVRLT